MFNNIKTKGGENMNIKTRKYLGLLRLQKLTMKDTDSLLYGNASGKTRQRKVSYRAKYTGNFSGGGVGSGRTTRQ
tara:strand:- start:279 stop:503 length:225 start_codon:yes stop_codon:yes gene_type:complete